MVAQERKLVGIRRAELTKDMGDLFGVRDVHDLDYGNGFMGYTLMS